MSKPRLVRNAMQYIALLLLGSLGLSGCMLWRAWEDEQDYAQLARIDGTVRTERATQKPLMVVLLPASSQAGTTAKELEIVDHFIRERAGNYVFIVVPGNYILAAFEDVNSDGNYDTGEPLLTEPSMRPFQIAAGETRTVDLLIPTPKSAPAHVDAPINIAQVQARSLRGQAVRSVGQVLTKGSVANILDKKFGPESGPLGLWEPLNAMIQVGGGIYFTEPYDPKRVPVLFVHGISGYPQEFIELINALDRDAFQAWFYFYPSGASLNDIAEWGADTMRELQIRLGFDTFAVVAHSMGGLISRELILRHANQSGRDDVRVLLTLSTPWGGHKSAQAGVSYSPVVVQSWRDIAPNSEFLKNLFWRANDARTPRTLPPKTAFHMLWGYGGPANNTDGVVSIASQQRNEAQAEVKSNRGYNENHASILRSKEVKARVNSILAEVFD